MTAIQDVFTCVWGCKRHWKYTGNRRDGRYEALMGEALMGGFIDPRAIRKARQRAVDRTTVMCSFKSRSQNRM